MVTSNCCDVCLESSAKVGTVNTTVRKSMWAKILFIRFVREKKGWSDSGSDCLLCESRVPIRTQNKNSTQWNLDSMNSGQCRKVYRDTGTGRDLRWQETQRSTALKFPTPPNVKFEESTTGHPANNVIKRNVESGQFVELRIVSPGLNIASRTNPDLVESVSLCLCLLKSS